MMRRRTFLSLVGACLLRPALTHAQGGPPMPSLEDERKTYRAWGWTWSASVEPNLPGDPNYYVSDPDIHGDTEGDDLWSYLMMYRRTGQQGYFDRARAWARYFKNDYRASAGFNYDRGFRLDHLYGWGLVAWYEHTGDAAALAEAENLAAEAEAIYSDPGYVPGRANLGFYGLRKGARHLLLATRVAEVTRKDRWITLRNKLIDLWLQSPDWDARGMYFDAAYDPAAYARGERLVAAFQVGVLTQAFDHAYRTTGRTELRDRMVAMAQFVDQRGLDPTYQYTGSVFGIVNGATYHNYSARPPVTFWAPVYTTSLVNTLVAGYKYGGDRRLYDRAKYFFNRGTKGLYGEPIKRAADDTKVHHFVDTVLASSHGNFYLDYNKGELQYTYLLFENGGLPSQPGGALPPQPGGGLPPKPDAPTGLQVR